MKAAYDTSWNRFVNLVCAPIIFFTRFHHRRKFKAAMIELKTILADPRGRIDAPQKVKILMPDAVFFGIPETLAGCNSFAELKKKAEESKKRALLFTIQKRSGG